MEGGSKPWGEEFPPLSLELFDPHGKVLKMAACNSDTDLKLVSYPEQETGHNQSSPNVLGEETSQTRPGGGSWRWGPEGHAA